MEHEGVVRGEQALRPNPPILSDDFGSIEIRTDPIFIIGSPRSGTTILALSLARHGSLWYTGEGHILAALFGPQRLDEIYRKARALNTWLPRLNVSRVEFLEFVGLGINALYTGR